jgi:hypothetical protein
MAVPAAPNDLNADLRAILAAIRREIQVTRATAARVVAILNRSG